MEENKEIRIDKIIVHILDQEAGMPILSQEEHLMEDEVREFLEVHIQRAMRDSSLKKAHFSTGNNPIQAICQGIGEDPEQFNYLTGEIAKTLYAIMEKHCEIPSADLVGVLFNWDETPFLGIMKFDYKTSYIHYVDSNENKIVNKIVKQKTTLPNQNQKIDECALINLRDYSINLLEKIHEIDGEKQFYFSTTFLNCKTRISDKEKVKIFKKANKTFNKTYFDSDHSKMGHIKQAAKDTIEEKGSIDLGEIADNVFKGNQEMKETYVNHMKEVGFDETDIKINKEYGEKTFRKQKIKTDNGIEINLPVDYYTDKDKCEFINNPDGTISILIKNISKIVDR